MIFDNNGNLYGTTASLVGAGVYELSRSQGGWILSNIYRSNPNIASAGLIKDDLGNLYGATPDGGPLGGGTVFELTPSGGGWMYNLLYGLTGSFGPCCKVIMDAGGNLYRTTEADGANGWGSVFKLTPSGGGYTYTSLHDFGACGSDGCDPHGDPILDRGGTLYGTAGGGTAGVVWEITQ